MKRDMDLIRKILFAVGESGTTPIIPEIDGYTAEEIAYHSRLLRNAELITAVDTSTHDGEAYLIRGLTWAGHDFVEASRNETYGIRPKKLLKIKAVDVRLIF